MDGVPRQGEEVLHPSLLILQVPCPTHLFSSAIPGFYPLRQKRKPKEDGTEFCALF